MRILNSDVEKNSRPIYRALTVCCGVALTIIITLFSAVFPAHAITLEEAREEALRANLSIKISVEQKAFAEFKRDESFTMLLPEISLIADSFYLEEEIASHVPILDVDVITRENQLTFIGGVRLEQPVFEGGRKYYSFKEMESKAQEAHWVEQETVQEILFSVENAYFELLKAESLEQLALQHQSTVNTHLEEMEIKHKEGRVAHNEVLKVRVQNAQAERDVIKTKNDVSIAAGRLNLLLNRPFNVPIDAVDIYEPPPVTFTVEEAEQWAKAGNKALQRAFAERTTVEFERRVAKADYYPTITFSTEYTYQDGQPSFPDRQFGVFINMEWPIWHWGETKKKVAAMSAHEREIEHSIASLENEIAAGIREVFSQIDNVDEQIVADHEEIEQAEENLRITKIGFKHGRNTSTDVLDAEESLSVARTHYVQDVFNAFVVRAKLRYLMGKM